MRRNRGQDYTFSRKSIFALWILLVWLLAFTPAINAQTTITNVYDEAGRLVGVVDSSGDTVTYSYDAVGNLLSISRHSSSSISLIAFTPGKGTIGTTVTIYGTAFSTTPSSNTVTFNGVSATVTSSTATKIVTSVPSGASTGLISVTSPAGSISSATNFTVVSSTAPTISSFTPTIGASGTSVSISGTNFETTALNNNTRFNTTYAQVSSATTTSVSTAVPSGGASGKISIATPNGTAVSADDFFIPPLSYTASDVAVTGRMLAGDSKTISLPTANKVGLTLFEGTAGQRVGIKITSSSITSTGLTVFNPKGIAIGNATVGTSGGFLETSPLTITGTYTILTDPSSTYTGNITFTLYLSTDATNTISSNGTGVTITTTTPGQNGRLSFNATANQRVYLKISSVSLSGGTQNWVNVALRRLDSASITSNTFDSNGGFFDSLTLTEEGTYFIDIDPTTASTGSVTFTLYNVAADITGSIATDGTAVTPTTTLGQNAKYTFSGTASDRMFLKISSVSMTGGSPNWTNVAIKKPDGTTLISTTVTTSGQIDTVTLPVTGTYTVLGDPLNTSAGSMTLQLYNVPADVTGTITPGGSAVSVTTTTPGQNASYTFSGTASQRVSLNVTSVSFTGNSWVTIYIKKPDGSTLTSTTVDTSGGFIDTKTLPVNGTYSVIVDPVNFNTGSLTLTLYDVPADASNSTTVNGSGVTVTTTVPGQNAEVTFSGTSSQLVTVRITSNSMGFTTVKLLKPDGTQLTQFTSSSTSFNLLQQTLPTTGTYKVVADPSGTNTGSITVAVTNP